MKFGLDDIEKAKTRFEDLDDHVKEMLEIIWKGDAQYFEDHPDKAYLDRPTHPFEVPEEFRDGKEANLMGRIFQVGPNAKITYNYYEGDDLPETLEEFIPPAIMEYIQKETQKKPESSP